MSVARRSPPVALVLLALLAALPASAGVAAVGSPEVVVDAGATPTDAGCCCEADPGCGSPAEPCAPSGDCCAACVACSARVVRAPDGAEPDRLDGGEHRRPVEAWTVGSGLGEGVWHPPRG